MIARLLLLCLSAIAAPAISGAANTDMHKISLDGWRLVTDGVMGGVSQGEMARTQRDGRECLQLSGSVSTRNNGGFIQLARDLSDSELANIGQYHGVRLLVAGNEQAYNVHLRTTGLWFPWQAYRATFQAGQGWSTIELPFETFQGYKTSQKFEAGRLKRIGIVAIGRDFEADLCVAEIGFY